MSVNTIEKLKHVLKMNSDAMTNTGEVYLKQAIEEVEEMLRILSELNDYGDVFFEDSKNCDALLKVLGL